MYRRKASPETVTSSRVYTVNPSQWLSCSTSSAIIRPLCGYLVHISTTYLPLRVLTYNIGEGVPCKRKANPKVPRRLSANKKQTVTKRVISSESQNYDASFRISLPLILPETVRWLWLLSTLPVQFFSPEMSPSLCEGVSFKVLFFKWPLWRAAATE